MGPLVRPCKISEIAIVDRARITGENREVSSLPQSGPVAQLGARFHGMEEVVGSIPTRSTNLSHKWRRFMFSKVRRRKGFTSGAPNGD
jgi:hypothetical protein